MVASAEPGRILVSKRQIQPEYGDEEADAGRDCIHTCIHTCAMAFVECLGFSQEDTMEGSLWRETLGRSLGA